MVGLHALMLSTVQLNRLVLLSWTVSLNFLQGEMCQLTLYGMPIPLQW